jgi:hypothetical protein
VKLKKEMKYKNISIFNRDLVDGKLAKQYPDITGDFDCFISSQMSSLKGCPDEVGGDFRCSSKDITTLKGSPKKVGADFICVGPEIPSLEGIGKDYLQEINGELHLNNFKGLTSHMLGIMRIKKLKRIYFDANTKVETIFNKHLSGDRNMFACQSELMEAGFKDFAKL